jgi:hypothetical protein
MQEQVEVQVEDRSPVEELRQSIFLIALMASSVSAYLAIGVVAVRIFAGR